MAITDNKTFGWNVGWKQIAGLVGIAAVVYLAIHFNSLVIGYIAMSLVLSALFLVVAFDFGVPTRGRVEGDDVGTGRSAR